MILRLLKITGYFEECPTIWVCLMLLWKGGAWAFLTKDQTRASPDSFLMSGPEVQF